MRRFKDVKTDWEEMHLNLMDFPEENIMNPELDTSKTEISRKGPIEVSTVQSSLGLHNGDYSLTDLAPAERSGLQQTHDSGTW
jgi:hypothetical protein